MVTRVYRPTPTNIARLGASLRRGKLVAVPSETVYGLAADATNADACAQIFAAKKRPSHDPLIVHVASIAQAKELSVWNDTAQLLAKAFWAGPLTLVLPRREGMVPDIVTSGRPTVALRRPAHPVFQSLIRAAERPLAAPSANPFGYISPSCAQHVKNSLNGKIPAILDGGPCSIGLESTIVDVSREGKITLLRPGGIPRKALVRATGRSIPRPRIKQIDSTSAYMAPGMMDRHYSPRTPTYTHSSLEPSSDESAVWVHFSAASLKASPNSNNQIALTSSGSGEEAARKLYTLLRDLDERGFSAIHLEQAPLNDLWSEAINDRLKRAANANIRDND